MTCDGVWKMAPLKLLIHNQKKNKKIKIYDTYKIT